MSGVVVNESREYSVDNEHCKKECQAHKDDDGTGDFVRIVPDPPPAA
jgi:hypothetical protein